MQELRRIIEDSEVMQEDDNLWPQPDRVGRQELEIVMDNEHISFTTSKIGSLLDVNQSKLVFSLCLDLKMPILDYLYDSIIGNVCHHLIIILIIISS